MVESVEVVGRTTHEGLPQAARARLGTRSGQVNLLLRIVLRPIDRTLASEQANARAGDRWGRLDTALRFGAPLPEPWWPSP